MGDARWRRLRSQELRRIDGGTALSRMLTPRTALPGLALLLSISAGVAGCDEVRYNHATFKATHNSYSGDIEGKRGSLVSQLAGGVRCVELDIVDDDFRQVGDYRLGHGGPGDQVSHQAPNPASDRLGDWLQTITDWSASDPAHAPIAIILDLKSSLADNPSHHDGNLAALNDRLRSALGSKLFTPEDVAAVWPSVKSMRGRVLVVLSGNEDTRSAYRRDRGANPAVAVNARGQVLEVHDSGHGTLWYWSGELRDDGKVLWHRHGRYDTGMTPAVALADDGWIVEVHKSENNDGLWYHTGRMGTDFEVSWSPSRRIGVNDGGDQGVLPTVRFTSAGGREVREVHKSQSHEQNWDWWGTLETATGTVVWDGTRHHPTDDPRHDKARDSAGDSWVAVRTGVDASAPVDTLLYATASTPTARIRYQQLAFVEYQNGDGPELRDGAWFYAAPAGDSNFITDARVASRLIRAWKFNDGGLGTTPPANFPATDFPAAQWYLDYARTIHTLR